MRPQLVLELHCFKFTMELKNQSHLFQESSAEKNYNTTQLELAAISWALTRLRNLVYGIPIKIQTDHHALCWLLRSHKNELSPKLSRMALKFSDYDIEGIYHISGKKHEVPVCLSRFPTATYSEEDRLKDLPILSLTTNSISKMQDTDQQIEQIKDEITTNTTYQRNFSCENGILYYKNANSDNLSLVIPARMTASILSECHDDPIAGGHLGFYKTYKKIQHRYYRSKMKKDITAYVKTCHACQQRKIPRHRPFGTMQYIKVPSEAFHRVRIDVMGPFTTSAKEAKYVITAIEYLTKWIKARALKEATTETIAKFFIEEIICRHGCPKILHTERGTVFTSELFQEINKFMGIKQHVSTSYH